MPKLIFISCGQADPAEKKLGLAVAKLIRRQPGFEAFFAEEVTSFDPLPTLIFDNLARASGAVFIVHPRGKVKSNAKRAFIRGSVWIQQEISLFAFLRHREGLQIPMLAFRAEGVELEGASLSLLMNPRPLPAQRKLLGIVKDWLAKEEFAERPGTLLGRFEMLLRVSSWTDVPINDHQKLFCDRDDSFNVVVGKASDTYSEAWTDTFPDKTAKAHYVHLNYRDHTLKHLPFIMCDGTRFDIPQPELKPGGAGFVLHRDSLKYLVGQRIAMAEGWDLEKVATGAGIELR